MDKVTKTVELDNVCEAEVNIQRKDKKNKTIYNTIPDEKVEGMSCLCCVNVYYMFNNDGDMANLPDDALNRELKGLFNWLDEYHKGFIDCIDFKKMLNKLGHYESDDKLKKEMKNIAKNRYGKIKYNSFVRLLTIEEPDSTFDQMFRYVDKNSKGYINEEDLIYLFKELHLHIDQENIKQLLEESGSISKKVDKETFIKLMTGE